MIYALNHLYDLRSVLGGIDEGVFQIAKSNLFAVVAIIMVGYWVRIATLSQRLAGAGLALCHAVRRRVSLPFPALHLLAARPAA